MAWLTSNWRWAALNLWAGSVLTLVMSLGRTDWNATDTFDPGLESGKWAIRFLLVCLAVTPLHTYFGWRSLISLRKPAGLWAFGFAVLHVLVYLKEAGWAWLAWPIQFYIALGLLGLLILTALALTSNRWAMRRLRKHWKRLHRLVYLAGSAGVMHAILATSASKKVLVHDPQAIYELNVYLAALVVLLVVRIPLVRRGLKQTLALRRSQRQAELPIIPLPIPDKPWQYGPPGYAREMTIPLDDLVAEAHPQEDYAPLAEDALFNPSRRN
ncbi:MAG: ferric reductase-like transmembrane domain-containing protein [Anaerolineales bacterium]|nr:ferric reductase-like transmembrane domain-containing protein [Anaerolineales bacterium]